MVKDLKPRMRAFAVNREFMYTSSSDSSSDDMHWMKKMNHLEYTVSSQLACWRHNQCQESAQG
eukprot:m.84669 g.84669  ORF g.84669 m.84669 type:complete len:63 (+) comp14393_c12_seq1:210-398(+)